MSESSFRAKREPRTDESDLSRFPVPGHLALRGILAELLVQRVAVDAEARRRLDLHLIAHLQDLLDQLALDAADEFLVERALLRRHALNAGPDQVLDQAR